MKKSKKACDLDSCFFCRQLTKEWLPLVSLRREAFTVKRGEHLFLEGDQVRGVYFLESGRVKVHQRWTEDKELILRFAEAGAIVGHRGLGKDLYYPVTATALENCSICFVPLDFFYASLKTNPDLLLRMMLFFAEELRESEQRMRNMARLPVKSRVAGALLALEEKFGIDNEGFLHLPIGRQDLAAYVGATYETVFRMLQELAEAGWIVADGKRLALSDKPQLAGLVTG